MRQYIALIHKEPGSDYGVSFPDLPGVISAGKTFDEARDMGAEALALHLEGLAADGEAAPEPSSLEEIMKDAQNKDGVAVLIAAPAADVKSVRINVTMPADVLRSNRSLRRTRKGLRILVSAQASEEMQCQLKRWTIRARSAPRFCPMRCRQRARSPKERITFDRIEFGLEYRSTIIETFS